MWYLLVLLVFSGCSAFAQDSSYTYEQARWNKSLKELHPDEKVRQQQLVQVDRSVLSKADYESDPEVLISKPRAISMREIEEKIVVVKEPVYVVRDSEPNVTVTWSED